MRLPAVRPMPLILILAFGLLLAGCGAGSALFENVGSNLSGTGGEPAGQPAEGQGADRDSAGGSGEEERPPLTAPIEQRIIKTG
ncbi:MAG: hypothetical protein M3Y40_10300, partial [Chloroflexota bacterium]|nr:hypothetical protein [Chloroflexota bacterium]